MNWNQLTVLQVQQIDKIRRTATKEDIEADVNTRLLSVITGKSETEIDSMKLLEYRELCKQLDFLDTEITGRPVRFISIGKKRYRCIYHVERMPFARYIEGKHFSGDIIGNLHKIAASITIPQKRTLFGYRDKKYNAADHIEYANDMLQARFVDIYHSCIFFYHVYRNWIGVSVDYLTSQAASKEMSKVEAAKSVSDLCDSLDGFIPPKLLPNLRAYR